MISVRMLTGDEVKEQLEEVGCTKHNNMPGMPAEHGLWRSPKGDFFFVPEIGPDCMCSAWRLQEIMGKMNLI